MADGKSENKWYVLLLIYSVRSSRCRLLLELDDDGEKFTLKGSLFLVSVVLTPRWLAVSGSQMRNSRVFSVKFIQNRAQRASKS